MSKSPRSPRNKTLDLPLSELEDAFARCLKPKEKLSREEAENRVICGDLFKTAPLLPRESYSLMIADPPYNRRKNYGGEVFSPKNAAAYAEYTRAWLSAVRPLLTPTASVYVCCDWQTSVLIAPVLGEFFHVRSRITWGREKGRGAKRNWKNAMEDIWFCTAGEDYVFHLDAVKLRRRVKAPYRADGSPKDWRQTEAGRFRDTCPPNFWDDIAVPFWSMPENTAHPAQKPEKLLAKLILASSDENDLILDPFAGSGSAAVAAKKLGRRFTAVEKNAQYCAWSVVRLDRAETDRRIQGYEDGVFYKY